MSIEKYVIEKYEVYRSDAENGDTALKGIKHRIEWNPGIVWAPFIPLTTCSNFNSVKIQTSKQKTRAMWLRLKFKNH